MTQSKLVELTEEEKKKLNKRIPRYFILFFVCLAILDGFLVTTAFKTHRGLVTDNAYQKGLDYNDTVAAYNQQEKLGWQADINYANSELTLKLNDANNNKIEDAKVTAYFTRVTQAGDDFSAKLTYNTNGLYSGDIDFPEKGQWDVRIAVIWKDQKYQKRKRIVVQ